MSTLSVLSNMSAIPEFNFRTTKLMRIPIASIRENADALRTTVDRENPSFQLNAESVKRHGVMLPILVREVVDPVSGDIIYGLIDGLHRLNWAIDAGMEEIPANVGSLEEAELLEAQIIANLARVETTPVQFTRALVRMMGANPAMTLNEIATRVSQSVKWVQDRLGLLKLTEEIQKLVDEDRIPLTNAYSLSRLPEDKQTELLAQAQSQPAAQFVPFAENLRKELATARREGRAAQVDTFVPQPHLKRMAELKDERAFANTEPGNSVVVQLAKQHNVATVEQAIAFALNWVLSMDPTSLSAAEADWKAQRAKAAQAKQERAEARKTERDQKAKAAVGVGPLIAVPTVSVA